MGRERQARAPGADTFTSSPPRSIDPALAPAPVPRTVSAPVLLLVLLHPSREPHRRPCSCSCSCTRPERRELSGPSRSVVPMSRTSRASAPRRHEPCAVGGHDRPRQTSSASPAPAPQANRVSRRHRATACHQGRRDPRCEAPRRSPPRREERVLQYRRRGRAMVASRQSACVHDCSWRVRGSPCGTRGGGCHRRGRAGAPGCVLRGHHSPLCVAHRARLVARSRHCVRPAEPGTGAGARARAGLASLPTR